MSIINIGSEAINRPQSATPNYTRIIKENPATDSGVITSIEIWGTIDLLNCEVAIFNEVESNIFTTRDNVLIGTVPSGAKRTFEVNLDVRSGDYIGLYYSNGQIECNSSGGQGFWYESGDIIPCTYHLFSSFLSGYTLSLCGIGETVPPLPKDSARTGIYIFKTLQ